MKVILNEDIANLGEEGDIKNVARGYARNYLIPNSLVMPYSRQALVMLESRRDALARRKEDKRTAALDIKTRLEAEPLVIEMPAGDRGRLFGSVTSATIAEALAAKGIDVERKRIEIPEKTIKSVGTAYVRIRLYADHEAELRVDIRVAGGAAAAAAASADAASPAAERVAAPSTPESDADAPDTDSDSQDFAEGDSEDTDE